MGNTEIILKNPKTCNHCAALHASKGESQNCLLGYLIQKETGDVLWKKFTACEDLPINIKPAEPCPKPKNIKEKLAIAQQIDVHRYSRIGSPEYNRLYGDVKIT